MVSDLKDFFSKRVDTFIIITALHGLLLILVTFGIASATMPCRDTGVRLTGCVVENRISGQLTYYKLHGEKDTNEYDVLAQELDFKETCKVSDATINNDHRKSYRRFSALCLCETFDAGKYEGQIVSIVTKQTGQCRPTYKHCPTDVTIEGSCLPVSMTGCVIDGVVFLSDISMGNIKVDIGRVAGSNLKLFHSERPPTGKQGTALSQYDGKSVIFRDVEFHPKDFSDFNVDGKGTFPLPKVQPEVTGDCNLQPGYSLYDRVRHYFIYNLIDAALKKKQYVLSEKYALTGERYLVPQMASESACDYFTDLKDKFMEYERIDVAVNAAYRHDKCRGTVDELEKLGDMLIQKGNKSAARKAYEKGIELSTNEEIIKQLREKIKN